MFAINNVIDEFLTKRLKRYLAMTDDKRFSDIVVKDGNVLVHHLLLRPETVNAKLAELHIPAQVKMCSCHKVEVRIPWFSLSTKNLEVVVENLMVLLHVLPASDVTVEQERCSPHTRGGKIPWGPCVEWRDNDSDRGGVHAAQVCAAREREILEAMKALVERQRRPAQGRHAEGDDLERKPGLFARLKAKLQESFRPHVKLKNIHIRYEQFPRSGGGRRVSDGIVHLSDAFSLGFILSHLTIRRDDGGDDNPSTTRVKFALDSVGSYCHTWEEEGEVADDVGFARISHSHDDAFFSEQQRLRERMLQLYHSFLNGAVSGRTQRMSTPSRKGWLFGPINLRGTLLNAAFSASQLSRPERNMTLKVPPLCFSLTSRQLSAFAAIEGVIVGHRLLHAYLPLRPARRVKGGARARAFWQAAGHAVITVASRRKGMRMHVMEALALKKVYMKIHFKMLAAAPADETDDLEELLAARKYLSAEDEKQLRRIDDVVSPHVTAYWRVLACVQHAHELVMQRARNSSPISKTLHHLGQAIGRKSKVLGLSLDAELSDELKEFEVQLNKGRRPPAKSVLPAAFVHTLLTVHLDLLRVKLILAAGERSEQLHEVLSADIQVMEVRHAISRLKKVFDMQLHQLTIIDPRGVAGGGAPAPVLSITGEAFSKASSVALFTGDSSSEAMFLESLKLQGKVGYRTVGTPRGSAFKRRGFRRGLLGLLCGCLRKQSVDYSDKEKELALRKAKEQHSAESTSTISECLPVERAVPVHAISASVFMAGEGNSGVHATIGMVNIYYMGSFFERQADFFQRVEQTLQRSSVLGTSRLRKKYPHMLRNINFHLKRHWWKLQSSLFNLIASSALTVTILPSMPVLDVTVAGIRGRFATECKRGRLDALHQCINVSYELQKISVPALHLTRGFTPGTNELEAKAKLFGTFRVSAPETLLLIEQLAKHASPDANQHRATEVLEHVVAKHTRMAVDSALVA